MGLDIRIPIGLMFGLIGAMLGFYGVVSDRAIYERSLGINVNLWWGVLLMLFGGAMLALARRARGAGSSAPKASAGVEQARPGPGD